MDLGVFKGYNFFANVTDSCKYAFFFRNLLYKDHVYCFSDVL